MVDIVEQLKTLSTAPLQKEAFELWLTMQDAIAFLRDNVKADEFVAYAGGEGVFLHAVLVPRSAVAPPHAEDLLSWDFNATSSWGIWTTLDETPLVSISLPLDNPRSNSFNGAEQLVFARFFEARLGNKSYYEVLQKFIQISGLHYIHERNAYCQLDDHGDIEDAIRIIQTQEKGEHFALNVVIFKRSVLDQYAALTDSVILRTFDFTRFRQSEFRMWSPTKLKQISDKDLIYHLHLEPGRASYIRGVQVIEPRITKEIAARQYAYGKRTERQYASFIALDWKNGRVVEISCAPDKTANYFTKSDLPFETSPAFFRPEVLLRYKADPEKYQIAHRSITCRGAWSLSSFDINEAGQVHAYICDLRTLPFDEQLYWKSHNEAPKAGISKRAYATDFEAKWFDEYDALSSVKHRIHEWNRKCVPWWTLRNKGLPDRVNYPVTSSVEEWSEELLNLDKLVVEGFEHQWLKKHAEALGRTIDIKWRSLKLVEECLLGLAFEADHASNIMASLQTLHLLRSKLKGHASGNEAVEIQQAVIRDHHTYKDHFRNLCGDVDKSLSTIEEALAKFI